MIGLAYDEDAQILFANAQTAAGGFGLFTLNVSTGVATFVGANGALTADEFGLDGLAWVPNDQRLPEPSALMLVGAALIGLASMRRRRTAHPA